jgi:Fe-S-cluster-containing hydrogenase component 2
MACDACKEYCQMDALVSVHHHTEVLDSHCIGCGVCLQACSSGAITLKKAEQKSIPHKDTGDMYKKMMMERYGTLGSLKILGKAALGKKI